MVKVRNPLFSGSASGKFAKNLFFQRKRSSVSVSMFGKKSKSITPLQYANSLKYKEACILWSSKTALSKNQYILRAQGTKQTGFNLFLQEYFFGSLRSRLGMNFGHDIDYGAEIVESEILADLELLKSHGIYKIRVAMPTYTHAVATAKLKQVCLLAKSAGCSVHWGLAVGDSTLTLATLPDYANAVLAVAEWAQQNNLDEFSLGNEMEYSHDETITDQDLRDFLRSLATQVKAVYDRGPVFYTVVGNLSGHSADWIAENNLGDIDMLGVNVYVYNGTEFAWFWSVINNMQEVFSGRFCLTEFNLWGGEGFDYFSNLDESELTNKLKATLSLLSDFPDIALYFFCWRFPDDWWATMKADNQLRDWFKILT